MCFSLLGHLFHLLCIPISYFRVGKTIGHVGLMSLSHFRRLLHPAAQPSSHMFHVGCIWCERTSTPDDCASTPNDPRVPVFVQVYVLLQHRSQSRVGRPSPLLRLQPRPCLYEVRNSHQQASKILRVGCSGVIAEVSTYCFLSFIRQIPTMG